MKADFFETERLLLRKAVPEDLAAIYAILSDARAMTYWSTPPHRSPEQSAVWLQSMIDIEPGAGEDFIIEHHDVVIGKAGFYRFPEIGFILHPHYWGQGFATEAMRTVIERAFAVHGLAAIDADVDPRNMGSLRLLGSLGFEKFGYRERSWLVGGQWCDSLDLRLCAEHWRSTQIAMAAST